MRITEHYDLSLPEGTDKVLVSILNENMDKIDEILADIYSKLPEPDYYTIPFEIPASWYQDVEIGEDVGPVIWRDKNISNIEIGSHYKLTIFDTANNTYYAEGVGESLEGLVQINFSFADSGLPQSISDLIYDNEKSITVVTGVDMSFESGEGFMVYFTVPQGTLSADIQAVINKFYLEKVTTPSNQ
jgi:hypothetical protein